MHYPDSRWPPCCQGKSRCVRKNIYDFMIDSLITIICFCDVTPSSDWDTHSPKFGFLTSLNIILPSSLMSQHGDQRWCSCREGIIDNNKLGLYKYFCFGDRKKTPDFIGNQ